MRILAYTAFSLISNWTFSQSNKSKISAVIQFPLVDIIDSTSVEQRDTLGNGAIEVYYLDTNKMGWHGGFERIGMDLWDVDGNLVSRYRKLPYGNLSYWFMMEDNRITFLNLGLGDTSHVILHFHINGNVSAMLPVGDSGLINGEVFFFSEHGILQRKDFFEDYPYDLFRSGILPDDED